jgi:hypothetical protein
MNIKVKMPATATHESQLCLLLATLGDGKETRINPTCVMQPKEDMVSRHCDIASQYSANKLHQCK